MDFIELDNLLLLRDLTRDQKSAVFELIKSAVAEATAERDASVNEIADCLNLLRASIINLLGNHLTGKTSAELASALDEYANTEVNPKLSEVNQLLEQLESQYATAEMNYGNLANENRNLVRLIQSKDEQVKELRVENAELRASYTELQKWYDETRAELLALRAELESETRWADQYKRERDAANEKHSDSVASRLRIELEQTRNQLAIAQQEAWKLREALLEINPPFVRLSESDPESYCLWCGNNKAYGHASNCKYAAALTQRNDAEKVK